MLSPTRHFFSLYKHRLDKKDFTAIFVQPSIKCYVDCLVLLACNNNFSYPRVGIIIAKKSVSSAVIRNKYRRIMREYIRLMLEFLPNVDLVIRIKYNAHPLTNDKLRYFLQKLVLSLQTKQGKLNEF